MFGSKFEVRAEPRVKIGWDSVNSHLENIHSVAVCNHIPSTTAEDCRADHAVCR
jgi:hypothetical protein